MFALIFKKKVCQLAGETFPVSPEMQWFDITGLSPEPQTGWVLDGEVLVPPPPVILSKAEMLSLLEKEKQSYIDLHYSPYTREWLLSYPQNPVATEEGKARVISAWTWINQVLAYMYGKMGLLNSGSTWEDLRLNFSQFDETDPHVTIEELL